jgi:hypothetical protein
MDGGSCMVEIARSRVPDADVRLGIAMMTVAPTVIAAARPFRTGSGGYRFVNAFRYAAGRTPARPRSAPTLGSRHG